MRRDGWNVYRGKHTGFSRSEAEATLSSVLNGFYFILTVFSRRDGESNQIGFIVDSRNMLLRFTFERCRPCNLLGF